MSTCGTWRTLARAGVWAARVWGAQAAARPRRQPRDPRAWEPAPRRELGVIRPPRTPSGSACWVRGLFPAGGSGVCGAPDCRAVLSQSRCRPQGPLPAARPPWGSDPACGPETFAGEARPLPDAGRRGQSLGSGGPCRWGSGSPPRSGRCGPERTVAPASGNEPPAVPPPPPRGKKPCGRWLS